MKDLGPATYFCGIQIDRDRQAGTLQLHQRTYVNQLLARHNLLEATTVATPMEAGGLPAPQDQGAALTHTQQNQYQGLLGKEMYLLQTMLNMAYTVSTLAQAMAEATATYWKGGRRALRHLKG